MAGKDIWQTWGTLKERPLVWMPDQKVALEQMKAGLDHMLAKAHEEVQAAEVHSYSPVAVDC